MSERILEILSPKPIPVDVEITLGDRTHRKKIHVNPLTLGDEKQWVEEIGNKNPLEKALDESDYSVLVDAVVRQIDPNDRNWLMAVFGVDNEEDLKEGILASRYKNALVTGLLELLLEVRGEGKHGDKPVKKKTAGSLLWTRWAFTCYGILVGALLTSGILLLDSWLPFIRNLLFKT